MRLERLPHVWAFSCIRVVQAGVDVDQGLDGRNNGSIPIGHDRRRHRCRHGLGLGLPTPIRMHRRARRQRRDLLPPNEDPDARRASRTEKRAQARHRPARRTTPMTTGSKTATRSTSSARTRSLADTDGGGVDDLQELLDNTDPLNPKDDGMVHTGSDTGRFGTGYWNRHGHRHRVPLPRPIRTPAFRHIPASTLDSGQPGAIGELHRRHHRGSGQRSPSHLRRRPRRPPIAATRSPRPSPPPTSFV